MTISVGGRRPWVVAALLAAAVTAVYWHVGTLGFVNFDDPRYVTQNTHVQRGLTLDGLVWAFSTFQVGNWHPLTWLSHMLDVELFGLDPGRHHVVNVVLHAVDTALLFAVLHVGTRRLWRSAFVAALFAVHPLHVESVAWISERKDVLSTLFWLLGTLAYIRYTRRPGAARMLVVALAMGLGLLSKPMLVTFPLTLLLLDVWPLARISPARLLTRDVLGLMGEKGPLLALSAASCVVTIMAQSRGGAVTSTGVLSLGDRLGNALVSYVVYLAKTFWPTRLAAVYPHPALGPGGLPTWQPLAALVVLTAISAAVLWQRGRRPYLAVGWAWYLVTLFPVVGVMQVGLQAMADRYTYVPLIGIFTAVTWLAADVAAPWRYGRRALGAVAGFLLAASGAVAQRQVEHWRDSFALFGHALEVVPDNWLALRNLGAAHQDARQYASAISSLEASLRLMPHDGQVWMNLALSYSSVGRHEEAIPCFDRALRMRPDDPIVWYNDAVAAAMRGDAERLGRAAERLSQLDPVLAGRLTDVLRRRGVGGF